AGPKCGPIEPDTVAPACRDGYALACGLDRPGAATPQGSALEASKQRRSRASGLAPNGRDLTPVWGAKNALLGRLRAVAGRLEGHPPTRLVSENDFAASVPRGTGARLVCPPAGRGIRLRPPAPALRRGSAGSRHLIPEASGL